MKKNIFETTYAQMQELKKAYEAAGDEAGKEKARAGHRALMEGIEGLGAAACRIWREYETHLDHPGQFAAVLCKKPCGLHRAAPSGGKGELFHRRYLCRICSESACYYRQKERICVLPKGETQKTEENRMLNRKFEGATLFEIDYTPKGTKTMKTMKTVKVWAKNRLDASNYMILNHIWGKQHEIRVATVNLMK